MARQVARHGAPMPVACCRKRRAHIQHLAPHTGAPTLPHKNGSLACDACPRPKRRARIGAAAPPCPPWLLHPAPGAAESKPQGGGATTNVSASHKRRRRRCGPGGEQPVLRSVRCIAATQWLLQSHMRRARHRLNLHTAAYEKQSWQQRRDSKQGCSQQHTTCVSVIPVLQAPL